MAWQNSLFISSQYGDLQDGGTETVADQEASVLINEGTIDGSPGTER
jgi:hypothetical protein